ncbi:AzlD domain-containing protein [Fictibacillus barbaricus]|uniref:Branched-subunit amino acid transport protein n=1 Tax=Fictibacillus barbaricus TaxID=182136 RepID=A0ABU1TVK8_9BACL|nr:AzlD domain-containing protein [Fictibacillus barbaricus]MDR7071211.1 branched-subunit amino acid transport protein [Fictibacillus barbaricus]
MNPDLIWVIVVMGIVTYIPRMLPLVLLHTNNLHPRIQGILKNVPFAILGALIFPGVLNINPDSYLYGIIGAAAAFIAAWLNLNVILVVLSSILVLYGYTFF